MPLILLAALLLAGCATPKGSWRVEGDVTEAERLEALELVEAARRILPDEQGWLAMGGVIYMRPDVTGVCSAPAPRVPTGCSSPHALWVLFPHPVHGRDLPASSLPHELCHIGLERPSTWFEPVIIPSDEQADACALLVRLEYLRSTSPP